MIGRIVEISNNNRYLSVYRGFLLVKSLGEEASELGRIPLDDILAVVTNAHGLSYSNNLLVSLLERDIPLVITSCLLYVEFLLILGQIRSDGHSLAC